MVYTELTVKENFGNKKMRIRIISRETISDSLKQIIQNMTFNEVLSYGNMKGWKVLSLEE